MIDAARGTWGPHDVDDLLPIDAELAAITDGHLAALHAMQLQPGRYVQRVVEGVEFLPGGGEQWTRDVQLQLPNLRTDNTASSGEHEFQDQQRYIVSLGSFARRRFPDFTVTVEGATHCYPLTRTQHGYALAICWIRKYLGADEWDAVADDASATERLEDLATQLTTMLTTIPVATDAADAAATDARKLLQKLLMSAPVTAQKGRAAKAGHLLEREWLEMSAETQYLCWVEARPGAVIRLRASFSRSERPYIKEEELSRSSGSPVRLALRNWRMRAYARYMLFPMHLGHQAPSPGSCGSYYFTVTPPPDTTVTLLDWETGHRFSPSASGRKATQPRAGEELDCARFACHFHPPVTGIAPAEAGDEFAGPSIHVFLRPLPLDHTKLATIGILGVGLAWLAQTGELTSASPGAAQWLLLGPAALMLFLAQQQRHHYARYTRRFRALIWAYVTVAMAFAASVAFDLSELLPAWESGYAVRAISGAFAVFSGVLVLGAFWTSGRFDRANRRRYWRVVDRLGWYGTPSLLLARYRYRRKPKEPLAHGAALRRLQREHPSPRIYSAVARHSLDRGAGCAAALATVAAVAMVLFGWGSDQACANRETEDAAKNSRQVAACADGTSDSESPARARKKRPNAEHADPDRRERRPDRPHRDPASSAA